MIHTRLSRQTLIGFWIALNTLVVVGAVRLPFLKKKYTPLVFFTVPKDLSPENDALENVVSEVEKELGVNVERLDVLRDPPSQVLLELLASAPPLLYNRESCQIVQAPAPRGAESADEKRKPATVDKARVIAWAKGRRLPSRSVAASQSSDSNKVKTPLVLSSEDNAIDQDELPDELSNLTPLQRKGKKAIKERTDGASD